MAVATRAQKRLCKVTSYSPEQIHVVANKPQISIFEEFMIAPRTDS